MTARPLLPFEEGLVQALESTAHFARAWVIYHAFQTGIFDELQAGEIDIDQLCERLQFHPQRFEALLNYMANEQLITRTRSSICLTPEGEALLPYQAWYTLFVGGYAETFASLGSTLTCEAPAASRNTELVAAGSGGIGHYDAVPLIRRLLSALGDGPHTVLDLGCGSAEGLIELVGDKHEWLGIGIEPDAGAYQHSVKIISDAGLADKIQMAQLSLEDFLRQPDGFQPSVAVIAFVLHELLASHGAEGISQLLGQLKARFPTMAYIVVEVDHQPMNPATMTHPLVRKYYTPYYLLHGFTHQSLQKGDFWRHLFQENGLHIKAEMTTSTDVDSTGLELGFLLEAEEN